MKRFLALTLALVFLVLPLASCEKDREEDLPEGMLRVRNAAQDFWLFYPENWVISENSDVLRLVSSEQSSLENLLNSSDVTSGDAVLPSNIANVSVMRVKEGVEDLSAYAQGEYREEISSVFVLDNNGEASKLGKDDLITFYYHMAGEDGIELYRVCQTLLLHEGAVYAVTFTATAQLYENLYDTFLSIRKSITFEPVADGENTPLTNAPDETVEEDAENVPPKEGLKALTNRGVDFILYYPEAGFEVAQSTGFLALKAENGATVTVARGDAYSAQILSPADYLDQQFYPTFDAVYGAHTELTRSDGVREDSWLTEVVYTARIAGVDYTFLQAMYLRQGYIYTLLYTAQTTDVDSNFEAVRTMIRELTFK